MNMTTKDLCRALLTGLRGLSRYSQIPISSDAWNCSFDFSSIVQRRMDSQYFAREFQLHLSPLFREHCNQILFPERIISKQRKFQRLKV
jgi:hypothetical protein